MYERIRSLREDRDLTQRQVAKILNVSHNTLSQYETNARNIPVDILIKLADFCGTSVDYLLGLTDVMQRHPKGR